MQRPDQAKQPNRARRPKIRRLIKPIRYVAALSMWALYLAPAQADMADKSAPPTSEQRPVVPPGMNLGQPLTPLGQPAPPPEKPKPSGADFKFSNHISNVTTQAGVLACASRVTQVTNFLVKPPKLAGALMMTVSEDRDEQLVPLLLETESEQGPMYISASFAPNQSNGCGATYEAVTYWPVKCNAVVFNKQFEWFKSAGVLHKKVQVLSKGNATKVFLMPAGSGCIVIKKEVVL